MVETVSKRLTGKVAVITGAASGIGRAIAERFAADGADLALVDLNSDRLEVLQHDLEATSARMICSQTDVANATAVGEAVDDILSRFGRIDILVNNAGIMIRKGFLEYSVSDWDRVMSVNLKSAFVFSRKVAPGMMKAGQGKIINIVSGAGMTGLARGAYGPSKAGLVNLTASMGLELAPYGINVNAISPGATATPMLEPVTASRETEETVLRTIPLGRLGTPADVAGPAAFLASSDADYMVGSVLIADGGQMTTFTPY